MRQLHTFGSGLGLLLVLCFLANIGQSAPQPPVPSEVYKAFEPKKPSGTTSCYATGKPSPVGDSVNLFTVYNCYNPDDKTLTPVVGYVNLAEDAHSVLLTLPPPGTGADRVSFASPMATGYHRAIVWTTGSDAQFSISGVNRPNTDGSVGKVSWTRKGTGWSTSTPTYTSIYNNAYLAVNKSIVALNLDHGGTSWNKTLTPANADYVSDVVFFPENSGKRGSLYWITDTLTASNPQINKIDGDGNGLVQSQASPCPLVAAQNDTFKLAFLQYGTDQNGPLNGLFMYGNYAPQQGHKQYGKVQSLFAICHFSHNSLKVTKDWGFNAAYDVYGVTAGDNATVWNVRDRSTNTYQVMVINVTADGNYKRDIINRTSADKDNNPVVIYGPPGSSPRIVMQRSLNGDKTVAYDTWIPESVRYSKVAWYNSYGCEQTATIAHSAGVDRVFCIGEDDNKVATSVDYRGILIWQQADIRTRFPAINMADVFVAYQLSFPLVGYSFDPDFSTPSPGNSPASGPSGGIIALIIIIIIFIIVLGVILFKIYTQKNSRRTASRMQLDKEGYAGLNA